MKAKSFCMFCGKSHQGRALPALCKAKGDVMRAYTDALGGASELWRVLAGIEQGLLDLDGEALRLVAKRRKAARCSHT